MGRKLARIAQLAVWVGPAVASAGCGRGSTATSRAVATAATVAALEVAAAAVSKSTSGCYTTCSYGTECNEATGLCEARSDCVGGGASATCGKTPEYVQATSGTAPRPTPAAEEPIDDSCAGFCLASERCVVYRGDLDCVPR